jgi:hypothetical protein
MNSLRGKPRAGNAGVCALQVAVRFRLDFGIISPYLDRGFAA